MVQRFFTPVATLDVDIFVLFEPAPLIPTLTPIYEACAKLGYSLKALRSSLRAGRCSFSPPASRWWLRRCAKR